MEKHGKDHIYERVQSDFGVNVLGTIIIAQGYH